MGSKSHASATLFLALNLLFLSLVTATYCPPRPPVCKPCTKPTPSPNPKPPPKAPKPPTTPTPKSPPSPPKTPPSPRSCPRDVLQLGVCGDLLGGLINIVIGTPSNKQCCSLLKGLADLDAAICLCTAIKANILGINLNVPISLSLLLNSCGYRKPSNFRCV